METIAKMPVDDKNLITYNREVGGTVRVFYCYRNGFCIEVTDDRGDSFINTGYDSFLKARGDALYFAFGPI